MGDAGIGVGLNKGGLKVQIVRLRPEAVKKRQGEIRQLFWGKIKLHSLRRWGGRESGWEEGELVFYSWVASTRLVSGVSSVISSMVTVW